jgi:hypothetical protein
MGISRRTVIFENTYVTKREYGTTPEKSMISMRLRSAVAIQENILR